MSSIRLRRPWFAGPAIFDGIAGELNSRVIDGERARLIGRRLGERVRRWVESHRDVATVRREDGRWAEVAPGVRRRVLRTDVDLGVELWSLAPRAAAPWPVDSLALEILVVEGGLALERYGSIAASVATLGHRVIARDGGVVLRGGDAGATLYVRRRGVGLHRLAPNEAAWWVMAQAEPRSQPVTAASWVPFCDGADVVVLQVRDDVASMLVRLAAGAKLPDHEHGLDEDCFMLSGELFLGDILMRPGDYQRARAGSRHVDSTSDTGALLHFHGALPGSASEGPA